MACRAIPPSRGWGDNPSREGGGGGGAILIPAPLPKGRIALVVLSTGDEEGRVNALRQRLRWRWSGKDRGKDGVAHPAGE